MNLTGGDEHNLSLRKEVFVWSLGVFTYLLLARVLPYDNEDGKEIARYPIQES